MSQHLTEEEQIETIKRWWAENGRALIIGVLLAVGAYFGWQAWQNQQHQAREAAAMLYEDLLETAIAEPGQSLADEQVTKAKSIVEELKEEHGGTLYAVNGALFLAKIGVEQDDLALAENELRWAAQQSQDSLTPLAQLRLAKVLYAQEKFDEASGVLDSIDSEAFTSSVAELRGDIHLAQGRREDARAAYQLALDELLPAQGNMRDIIQMKLDDVGGAQASANAEQGVES